MTAARITVQQYDKHRLIAIPGYMLPVRKYCIERKVGRKWLQICEMLNIDYDGTGRPFSDMVWALGRLEWPRIPQ